MIKLYLDENVPEAVALGLRLRGFDVVTVRDTEHKGLSDFEQLQYAASEKRAIFTFNVADFQKIHNEFLKGGNGTRRHYHFQTTPHRDNR